MIFAVVPAGGKSSRMGRPKLSLPFQGRTVLECVLDALRLGGCEEIVVVLGPHVADLEPLTRTAKAHVCLLEKETPDMRATVEKGLRRLEQHFQPSLRDAWLLAPADLPMLDPAIISAVRHAYLAHLDKSIVVPTFEGKRGHPTLFSWKHVQTIRDHPPDEGLNTYLRRYDAETLEVPVPTSTILFDLDTPEDYARLLK